MKKMLVAAMMMTSLLMTACGGGNGDGAPALGLNHNELATMFVNNLAGQIPVTMVKKSTDQSNFVVIYDADYDSYDAVNISGYQPGTDAWEFYKANVGKFFYDLDVIPGYWDERSSYSYSCDCYDYYDVWVEDRYRDRHSGITFEKVAASPKDLEKLAAVKEAATINKTVDTLQSQMGLSAERSLEVARLTVAWKKAGGKDLTVAEHDAFSKAALGFTITEAKDAVSDASKLDQLIDKAAATNGTSSENVREIIKNFMN